MDRLVRSWLGTTLVYRKLRSTVSQLVGNIPTELGRHWALFHPDIPYFTTFSWVSGLDYLHDSGLPMSPQVSSVKSKANEYFFFGKRVLKLVLVLPNFANNPIYTVGMITLIYHLNNLRIAIPALIMLGSSPTFMALWAPFRLLSLVLPKSVYVSTDDRIFSLYQRLVLFFFEHFTKTEVYLYGDAMDLMKEKENVIYISNHQCTLDWVVAEMLAVRQGSLGHVRYVLKDGLRYFPLYGFYFRQHSCVYVGRYRKFNEELARKQLSELNDLPFWLVIFPEGTRYSPYHADVIDRSQKFATENDLPVCDEVLTPRSKATWLSLTSLRHKADAVYDVTIAYSGTTDKNGNRTPAPGLPEFLAKTSSKIHIHVKRHSLADIPLDDEYTFRVWLAQRFQDKDRLMKQFYTFKNSDEASFSRGGQLSRLSLYETLPTFLFWTSTLVPQWLTSTGRIWYFHSSITSAAFSMLWMMIRK